MKEVNVSKSELDKVIDLINYAFSFGKPFEMILRFNPEQEESIVSASSDMKDHVSEVSEYDSEEYLEQIYTKYLIRLGFKANLKGYNYSRRALLMIHEDPDCINYITKRLYPQLAKEFNTTSSRVERAIRHAIETAWENGDMELIEEIFGYTVSKHKGKPTNSEFIALLADYIRVHTKKRG